jgi:gephyrin
MLRRTADGGEFTAVSTGGQISSRLLSMRSANALLELPAVRLLCLAILAHVLSYAPLPLSRPHAARMVVQVAGVLPAGSLVTALLIDDLSDMPVPDDVPLLMPKV